MQEIQKKLEPIRQMIKNHKIYKKIKTIEDLRILMQLHIFAVWDFMSLVKSLQIKLTCTTIPWISPVNPKISRFINEAVLDEESDINLYGEV